MACPPHAGVIAPRQKSRFQNSTPGWAVEDKAGALRQGKVALQNFSPGWVAFARRCVCQGESCFSSKFLVQGGLCGARSTVCCQVKINVSFFLQINVFLFHTKFQYMKPPTCIHRAYRTSVVMFVSSFVTWNFGEK